VVFFITSQSDFQDEILFLKKRILEKDGRFFGFHDFVGPPLLQVLQTTNQSKNLVPSLFRRVLELQKDRWTRLLFKWRSRDMKQGW
jgi:hypothetical protein